MQLRDIVSGPWAITPEMFDEVQGIYARHMRGEKIDLEGLEARIGKPLKGGRSEMTMDAQGVAVITMEGVLSKRMNLLSAISGGASTQVIGSQLQQALADDQVKAIVLAVDSPGGAVDGTQQLCDAIFAARGQKPIIAHVDGMCCSAAYWIASSCDKIMIDGDTTAVGSIGILCQHVDKSMRDAQAGVKVTEIKAGKYKAAGSSNGPLGAGEMVMQAQVDHIYGVFLEAVARNRGMTAEDVHTNMADGRIFLGRNATDVGLVDGVSTLAQVVAAALAEADDESNDATAIEASSAGVALMAAVEIPETQEVSAMDPITIEKVKADAPDVVAAIQAEAVAAEIGRVKAVRSMSRPGCEALIETLASDGKTTGPEAAVRVLAHLDTLKAQKLDDLKADAAGASGVPSAAVLDAEPKADGAKSYNPHEIAAKARVYKEQQAQVGNNLTDAQAVDAVIAGIAA